MANIDESEISDNEKIRIVSDFILHAPPGKEKRAFSFENRNLFDEKLFSRRV